MVSSTCLHFQVSRSRHPIGLTKLYQIYLALVLQYLAYLLCHSCHILLTFWGIIAVGMIITQSQQESQNKTGTQQEQEEHTKHIWVLAVLFTLAKS